MFNEKLTTYINFLKQKAHFIKYAYDLLIISKYTDFNIKIYFK